MPYEITPSETLEAAMKEREGYWEDAFTAKTWCASGAKTWAVGAHASTGDARGRLQVQAAVTPGAKLHAAGTRAPRRPVRLA